MAEIVEKHMERSMRDFELIRSLNILEEAEVNLIIKKREHFAYLLAKQTKVLKHYLEYIQFERGLLTLIAEHNRKKSGTEHLQLEQSLLRRIKDLYSQAVERFAGVEQLWDEYVLFCVQTKYDLADIAKIMSAMLQFHGSKSSAWLKCIAWNRLANPDLPYVKALAMKALQRHPTSMRIHAELMSISLSQLQIECVDEEGAANNDAVLKQASMVFESGYVNVPTLQFCLVMIDAVSPFAHTEELLNGIVVKMRESFANEPLCWHILALAKLNGGQISTTVQRFRDVSRSQIEECIQVYKEAVKTIDASSTWTYYLTTMLAINNNTKTLGSLKRRSLGKAFQQAEKANRLSEDLYLQYLEIMKAIGTNEDILSKVMNRAMTAYPKSQRIWWWCMRHHITVQNADETIKTIFSHCRTTMGNESIAVWELYFDFLKSKPNSNREIDHLYKMVIAEIHDNFNHLKANYLDWCYETHGMAHARLCYNQTCASAKPSLAMHERMLELEESQSVPNLKAWRKCLEMAITYYGNDNISLWLKYILFETKYGDPILASQLSGKAVKVLKSHLVERFMAENKQNLVV